MEIKQVSSEEFLVILDRDDQKNYEVCYKTMSFSDGKTRLLCEQLAVLICLCRSRVGIEDLSLRAMESASGDLLLRFTFSGEKEEGNLFSQVIEFSDLDGLLDSRNAFSPDPDLCAEIYRLDGKYYLWYEFYTSPVRFDGITRNLLEYGNRSSLDRAYLSEHADPLPQAARLFLS